MLRVYLEKEFTPDDLGAIVARANHEDQAEFFNGFAAHLKTCCAQKGGRGVGYQFQLSWIRPELNAEAIQVLSEMLPD